MPVNDQQVAALRAQLAGDHEQHKRLLQQVDAAGGMHDYMSLVSAAFLEAADRRFATASLPAAVIEWVADVRSRSPEASEAIDPAAAERVILSTLGQGDISDLSGRDIRHNMRLLLPLLIADEQLDGSALDAFMASARKLA
jgi:hypothetical protein